MYRYAQVFATQWILGVCTRFTGRPDAHYAGQMLRRRRASRGLHSRAYPDFGRGADEASHADIEATFLHNVSGGILSLHENTALQRQREGGLDQLRDDMIQASSESSEAAGNRGNSSRNVELDSCWHMLVKIATIAIAATRNRHCCAHRDAFLSDSSRA